jgi:hypothetical protein
MRSTEQEEENGERGKDRGAAGAAAAPRRN